MAYSLLAACRGVSWQLSCVNGAEEKQSQLNEWLFCNDVFLTPILNRASFKFDKHFVPWCFSSQQSMFHVHVRHLTRMVLPFIIVPVAAYGDTKQEQVLIVLDGNVIHFISISWKILMSLLITQSQNYILTIKNTNYKIISTNNICSFITRRCFITVYFCIVINTTVSLTVHCCVLRCH